MSRTGSSDTSSLVTPVTATKATSATEAVPLWRDSCCTTRGPVRATPQNALGVSKTSTPRGHTAPVTSRQGTATRRTSPAAHRANATRAASTPRLRAIPCHQVSASTTTSSTPTAASGGSSTVRLRLRSWAHVPWGRSRGRRASRRGLIGPARGGGRRVRPVPPRGGVPAGAGGPPPSGRPVGGARSRWPPAGEAVARWASVVLRGQAAGTLQCPAGDHQAPVTRCHGPPG